MFLFFFFYCSGVHRDLHSFPTRRSSELADRHRGHLRLGVRAAHRVAIDHRPLEMRRHHQGARSEEHTSELQSRGHLVCRLLLEKKKKRTVERESHNSNLTHASSTQDSSV